MPHQIEVRVGMETFAVLTVETFAVEAAPAPKAGDKPANDKPANDSKDPAAAAKKALDAEEVKP